MFESEKLKIFELKKALVFAVVVYVGAQNLMILQDLVHANGLF